MSRMSCEYVYGAESAVVWPPHLRRLWRDVHNGGVSIASAASKCFVAVIAHSQIVDVYQAEFEKALKKLKSPEETLLKDEVDAEYERIKAVWKRAKAMSQRLQYAGTTGST